MLGPCQKKTEGPMHTRKAQYTRTSLFFYRTQPIDRVSASPSPLPPPMATTATTTAAAATANFVPTPTPPHPRPAAPPALRAPSTLGPVKSEAPPTPSSSTAAAAAAGAEDPSYIITVPSYSGKQTRALAPRFYLLWRLKPGTLIGASPRSVVLV
jgi:hypothetical protein